MRLLRLSILLLVACWASVTVQAQETTLHDPAEYLSGTMPVLYVNTVDSRPIKDKKTFIDGSYWLDPNGIEGVEAIGSADEPLALQIKGRGNITWAHYDKKAYRIKLEKKAPLLGMKKSRQFLLMADAWDWKGCATEQVGFELSRRVGLTWTPERRPVELVLNGDYVGLYFVTEKITVAKDRVNIVEQDNFETDPELMTGGWLLEIDNTWDAQQITVTEEDGSSVRITHHSPDSLTHAQRQYLRDLFNAMDDAAYVPWKGDTEWERYIDLDSLVLYYLVSELADRGEAFSGSCYMHKDRGSDTKLIFGPVWDFGSSWTHSKNGLDSLFLYEGNAFPMHWIREIVKFPRFQRRVHEIWQEFYYDGLADDIANYAKAWARYIAAAGEADHRRWPQYKFDDAVNRVGSYTSRFRRRLAFLNSQFSTEYVVLDTISMPYVEQYARVGQHYTIDSDLLIYSDKTGNLLMTSGDGYWLQVDPEGLGIEGPLVGKCVQRGTLHGQMYRRAGNDMVLVPDREPQLADEATITEVVVERRHLVDTIRWKSSQVFDVTGYLLFDHGQYYLSPVQNVIDERALPLYFDEYSASTTLGEHYMMRLATRCVDGACVYQPLDVSSESSVADVRRDSEVLRIVDGCIYVDGAQSLAVYDMLGRQVGSRQGCRLAPGIYVVRAGSFSTRIVVR